MERKITKRDNFNEIIKIAENLNRKDLVDFCNHEIELLDRKKSSDTKTKTQVANESIKETILNVLNANKGTQMTITDIQNANTELSELSNQKMSALLKQLVDNQVICKVVDKKKAYFFAN